MKQEFLEELRSEIKAEKISDSYIKKIFNILSEDDYIQDILIQKGLDICCKMTGGADKALFTAAKLKWKELTEL